ncbi:hypothetical protein MNBD_PLANCTO02-1093 [hydrothermal vent metagenome]|uniref:Uncharacterized protein n=1 Tax=hydrothermal vent metagenome TaxID=652676 RepID=A0A3B1DNP8_9ZZZZ
MLQKTFFLFCAAFILISPAITFADDPAQENGKPVPLDKSKTVFLDKKGNRLLIKSKVALTRGPLEMLLCRTQTKEHESILSTDAKAFVIHTGLLALGAKQGAPVQYNPKYHPPTGQKVDIFLRWKDKAGKQHRVNAQKWIHHTIHRLFFVDLKTLPAGVTIDRKENLRFDSENGELSWYGPMPDKQRDKYLALSAHAKYQAAIKALYHKGQIRPMEADWVFAGSGFTKEKYYLAEDGYVICVANFPPALLDVTSKSSKSDEHLSYEAYSQRIPPKGTEVTIELIPIFEKKNAPPKKDKK